MITEPPTEKENIATLIIESGLKNSKNPCVCFSGGKGSLVLLHLIKLQGSRALPVIHIDTGVEFPEVNIYIQKMKKLWKLNLVVGNPGGKIPDISENPQYCCEKLKCKPLLKIVQHNEIDCIFLGNSSDNRETFSKVMIDHPDIKAKIIQPLVGFNNIDIWNYIRAQNLPYCSLYNKGYEKIDCKPCSLINSTLQRSNSEGTEEEIIKEKLRKLGYL